MRITRRLSNKEKFFIIGFTLLLLICYVTLVLNRTAPAEDRHIWINKWLKREAGLPPCWESICPGKTTRQEVESRLALLPEVTSFRQEVSEDNGNNIRWDFEDSSDGGKATFVANDRTVSSITLFVNDRQRVSLQEVIATYGDPTNILVYYCRDNQCLAQLLFINQGFLVETIVDVKQKKSVITGELIVYSIEFFPNSENGYRGTVGMGKVEAGYYYVWKGFGNYESTR